MKRRSFLKSAAAMLPAAGFDPMSIAEMPTREQEHVIEAGHDRLGEAHSRGYSSILFKVLPRETSNGLFVLEHMNLVECGPALLIHPLEEEDVYLISGEVRFALGNERLTLKAGDSVLGPRGIPHTIAAVKGTPSHMQLAFTPAAKIEECLRATAGPNPPKQDAEFWRTVDRELIGMAPFAGGECSSG